MALKTVQIHSKVYVAHCSCQEVAVCVGPDDADKVVADRPFVFGNLGSSGRFLGSGGSPFAPRFENPRCEEEYQYSFTYDDAQMETDPATGEPFELPCNPEIFPYACSLRALSE